MEDDSGKTKSNHLFTNLQSIIHDKKNRPKSHVYQNILVWTLGIVGLVGLTIRDFLPLLSDYTRNNVATQVDVIIVDPDFKPPQPLVCLPFYQLENRREESLMQIVRHLRNSSFDCRICENLKESGWGVWTHGNFSLLNLAELEEEFVYNALSLEFAKKLFCKETLDASADQWSSSPPVLSAAINFFLWLTKIDYHFKPHPLGPGLDVWNDIDPSDQSIFDRVFERILETFCERMSFAESEYLDEFQNSTHTNLTCVQLMSNPSIPVYLDRHGIWFPIPRAEKPELREYLFKLPYETGNDALWSPSKSEDEKSLLLYPDTSVQYLSAIDRIYTTSIFETPLGSPSDQRRGHFITARYSIQMRAVERRQIDCHDEPSAAVCFTKCMKIWLSNQCRCVPFSVKRGLPISNGSIDLPLCTPMHYELCKARDEPLDDDHHPRAKCLRKCKSACEYVSFNWHVNHRTYEPSVANSTEYKLWIGPSFNTFAEFAWVRKNSPEQFLSQTGGLLNFYLGISGMTVFGVLVMGMELARKLGRDGDLGERSDEDRESRGHWDRDHPKEGVKGQRELIAQMVKTEVKEALRMEMDAFRRNWK